MFRLYDLFAPARMVSEPFGVGRPAGFLVANGLLVLFGLWCWVATAPPLVAAGGWLLFRLAR